MSRHRSDDSVRMQSMQVLYTATKPLRALAIATAIDRTPKLVGSALVVCYQRGEISRVTMPGLGIYGYFMTREQKEQVRNLESGVLIKRYTIKLEPIDISARLIFLRKLADNPFWQEHTELHNIIADYQRAASLASPEDKDGDDELEKAA